MSDVRDVQQVLARCVRATEKRDGRAMSGLFALDGRIEIFSRQARSTGTCWQASGRCGHRPSRRRHDAAAPPRGKVITRPTTRSFRCMPTPATIDAQFIVYITVGGEKPASGMYKWR
jgi:hypothetical protein